MQTVNVSLLLATLVAQASMVAAQSCPSAWTDVAEDLRTTFVGDDGLCTDDARAAIRLAFHDCFPGTCDGSIILANECTDRAENIQMVDICATLGDKATQYDVGVADIIQFAAALGIVSCPGGPAVAFKAGRTDSSEASAEGEMPGRDDDAASTTAAFEAKGFTATELVALVGTHSSAADRTGEALDSTIGEMDTTFYTETLDGSAETSLNSDLFLSNSTETADTWESMADTATWQAAFVPAMEKMSLMGIDEASLTDCSDIIANFLG